MIQMGRGDSKRTPKMKRLTSQRRKKAIVKKRIAKEILPNRDGQVVAVKSAAAPKPKAIKRPAPTA
jgi:hypothetical protein